MTRPLLLLALLTMLGCVPAPEQRARCVARLRWARTWPDSQQVLNLMWGLGNHTCAELVTPHVNTLEGGDPRLIPGGADR
jgi:hypothetical protein